jgi:hypothetical protein
MGIKKKFLADYGEEIHGDLDVTGDVSISGGLSVLGTTTTIDSVTKSVDTSMFELANANTSNDLIDFGIYGNYNDGLSDGGASEFSGLFRDATDSTWKLFDGLEIEPTTTVNTEGTGWSYADLKVGDLESTGTLTAVGPLNLQNLRMDANNTLTTTATDEVTLDSFPLLSYRSGKYHVQASQGTNFHACEIMVIHDSSNATHQVYGSVHTNGELFTTTVDTNSGNVRLKVTPSSSNSTVFKISRNLLTV